MSRRLLAAYVTLPAAAIVAAARGAWLAVALLCMALTYLAGRAAGRQSAWDAAWYAAESHFKQQTRALVEQLTRLERAYADRTEAAYERVHNPRPMRDNGAGYRSRFATPDSPTARHATTAVGPSRT